MYCFSIHCVLTCIIFFYSGVLVEIARLRFQNQLLSLFLLIDDSDDETGNGKLFCVCLYLAVSTLYLYIKSVKNDDYITIHPHPLDRSRGKCLKSDMGIAKHLKIAK